MKWTRLIKAGTWSLPTTIDSISELNKLMSQPLPAREAADKLYDIFGDDDLFDEIDEVAESNPEADVRDVVKRHLRKADEDMEFNEDAYSEEELKEAKRAQKLWRRIYED